MRMRCAVAAALPGALLLAGLAAPADARTWHVHRGQSIQRAVNRAHSGDTILVARGRYRQRVVVRKSGIELIGHASRLLPPRHLRHKTVCERLEGKMNGFCVVGKIRLHGKSAPPTVIRAVHDVEVRGFRVRGFPGDGLLGFAADRMVVRHDRFVRNHDYGAAAFSSTRTHLLGNKAQGNGAPGLYVGDSPQAHAIIRRNRSFNNHGEGLLVRNASFGSITANAFGGNCAAILVVADAPGPAGGWNIARNRATKDNRACAGDPAEGEPPISGIGIGLAGANHTRVVQNTVTGHNPAGPSFAHGGIVVVSGPGGTAPVKDAVKRNEATGNSPDLFWDGKGSVTFASNTCTTSQPPGLCTST